jgi:apolipoprotein N-acyltransferase
MIIGSIMLFKLNKKELFITGFFIGIFWFWWIGYSFVQYQLSYLIPIVLIVIGIIYGMLFYFIALFSNIYYKIGYIFLLSFVEPFGFNWFKIELPLINSYIGTSKIEFFIFILTIGLFVKYRKNYKRLSYILFGLTILSLSIYKLSSSEVIKEPTLKIFKYNTKIAQENKWDTKYKQKIINYKLH